MQKKLKKYDELEEKNFHLLYTINFSDRVWPF